MNESKDMASAAASDAGAAFTSGWGFMAGSTLPYIGSLDAQIKPRRIRHHWLCEQKGYNPLCIGCEVEAAGERDRLAPVMRGALVTPDIDGAPCGQCGVTGSHLCRQSASQAAAIYQIEGIIFPDSWHDVSEAAYREHTKDGLYRVRTVYLVPPPLQRAPVGDSAYSAPFTSLGLPPSDIIEAAQKVYRWMNERNMGDKWELGGVCSRQALTAKQNRIAELEAELLSVSQGKRRAPWTDFEEKPIHVGDMIRHPDGMTAVVTLDPQQRGLSAWRAIYAGGESLWLGNQIGDKGRAVVVAAAGAA